MILISIIAAMVTCPIRVTPPHKSRQSSSTGTNVKIRINDTQSTITIHFISTMSYVIRDTVNKCLLNKSNICDIGQVVFCITHRPSNNPSKPVNEVHLDTTVKYGTNIQFFNTTKFTLNLYDWISRLLTHRKLANISHGYCINILITGILFANELTLVVF